MSSFTTDSLKTALFLLRSISVALLLYVCACAQKSEDEDFSCSVL